MNTLTESGSEMHQLEQIIEYEPTLRTKKIVVENVGINIFDIFYSPYHPTFIGNFNECCAFLKGAAIAYNDIIPNWTCQEEIKQLKNKRRSIRKIEQEYYLKMI